MSSEANKSAEVRYATKRGAPIRARLPECAAGCASQPSSPALLPRVQRHRAHNRPRAVCADPTPRQASPRLSDPVRDEPRSP